MTDRIKMPGLSAHSTVPDLEKALENLATFAQYNEQESFPNLSHFEVHEGKLVPTPYTSIHKTISLALSLVTSPQEEDRKQSEVLDEVLHSSDVVKSYLPLIQKLEQGDLEQQKFAAHAKAAVERFNNMIDHALQTPPSLGGRIARFLLEQRGWLIGKKLTKIDLPQNAAIRIDFPSLGNSEGIGKIQNPKLNCQSTAASSQKIAAVRETVMPTSQVSRQTLELFYMKVIAMLERHKLFSVLEARQLVRKTPVRTSLDKQTQTLTLLQTYIPIPGQTVEVAGSFQRDSRTFAYSIPLPDTYQVSTSSTQTGFPHPLQHNGWALTDVLIPACPHRPEKLSLFPAIQLRKKNLALSLLPRGSHLERAQDSSKLRKQTFGQNKQEFLGLHKELAKTIIQAVSPRSISEEFIHPINDFHSRLHIQENAFEYLSDIYQHIMNVCVNKPWEVLNQSWLENCHPDLHSQDPNRRLQAAQAILKDTSKSSVDDWLSTTEMDPSAINYCLIFVRILEKPLHDILLQHQSEVIGFAPPKLDQFSKKLQAALYLQLWEFLHEMDLDLQHVDMPRRMRRLLEDDIQLFKASNVDMLHWEAVAIVHELEAYYEARSAKVAAV